MQARRKEEEGRFILRFGGGPFPESSWISSKKAESPFCAMTRTAHEALHLCRVCGVHWNLRWTISNSSGAQTNFMSRKVDKDDLGSKYSNFNEDRKSKTF